jgi:hypothetical protein
MSLPAATGNLKQHAVILGLVPGISVNIPSFPAAMTSVRLMSHFVDHQAQKQPILRLMSHFLDHQPQVLVHFLDRYLQ